MKEKFIELCKNEEIVEKMKSLKTEEAFCSFLNENGIEANSMQEFQQIMMPTGVELDENELAELTGGAAGCLGYGMSDKGFSFDTGACLGYGTSYKGAAGETTGLGFALCYGPGIGFGSFGGKNESRKKK